ncbi:ABC transporter permease [Ferrimonas marina]|uniref:Sodium transport system permease protein n=1 Tax=Ferrimonas marina TaxID=299255 RepID=A0A1M5Z403_9GAMM|nr:ABC transporter permease [Ferrimonas marina]SHI18939.1 sodium transport system permease protein [Ferrimonas marina]
MLKLIWLKEMKEVLRDKKTFWFVVLMPTVILPALMGAGVYVGVKSVVQMHEAEKPFALDAPSPWREQIGAVLDEHERLVWQSEQRLSGEAELSAAVRAGEVDFALQLPAQFDPTQPVASEWQLYYNQADDVGQFASVEEALEPLFEQWRAQHRSNWSLTLEQAEVLNQPVTLNKVGTAAEREDLGQKLGGMLPYMLLLLCLMGAMMPALDIGAGEKERGTLETLLMAPQPRTTLVLAKFGVIVACSALVAVLTIASGLIWALVLGQVFAVNALVSAVSAIGAMDLLLILALLLPIIGFFSALLLALSVYARSFKEAQNYMAPINLVAILPAMVALFPGVELTTGLAWAPMVNVTLASKELIKGTMDYALLLPVFASNLLLAGLLLAFCCHWFRRESVLFR